MSSQLQGDNTLDKLQHDTLDYFLKTPMTEPATVSTVNQIELASGRQFSRQRRQGNGGPVERLVIRAFDRDIMRVRDA